MKKAHFFSLYFCLLALAFVLADTAVAGKEGVDRLGSEWSETEAGIAGQWVRRGNSATWDASWANGARAVLTITISGNQVKVIRKDTGAHAGLTANYTGPLDSNGTIKGTQTYTYQGTTKSQAWHAQITKGL